MSIMNISATLKASLFILTCLVLMHLFAVVNVHQSSSYDIFVDHRHLEGNIRRPSNKISPTTVKIKAITEQTPGYFNPVIIQSQHLAPLYLPEALRHPLHSNTSLSSKENSMGRCCEMASAKQTRKAPPKNIQCEGVCHTRRACTDILYPFQSAEEAKFFRPKVYNTGNIPALRQKCNQKNLLLHPPYEWCHQWMVAPLPNSNKLKQGQSTFIDGKSLDKFNHKYINPQSTGLPPPGCSQISKGGGSGPYQHLTLFPSAKLAFYVRC